MAKQGVGGPARRGGERPMAGQSMASSSSGYAAAVVLAATDLRKAYEARSSEAGLADRIVKW